jgi:peptidoglycan/LPS O-acetylase OafA/YrhL
MAMLVVWSHSFALYRGSEADEPLSLLTQGTMNSGNFAVLVFFMISGFLITQSFDRSRGYWSFLKKRIARIHPGFVVATSICAFVVIPLYSKDTVYTPLVVAKTIGLNLLLQGYFPDNSAFIHNPVHAVNGSLWSIPFEFWCYLGVLALGAAAFLKPRSRPLLLCAFIMLALVRSWLELTGRKPGGGMIGNIIGWPYTWFRVLPCFLAGILAYQYRDALPRSLAIALLGPLLTVASVNLPISIEWKSAFLAVIFPPALAYSLFYFAFKKQLLDAAKFGDFSYGTYLYAFPIQQMLRADLGTQLPFWLFIPLAMIFSLMAGVLSWYCVERWFQSTKPRQQKAAN